jgi:hypothetical protein
MTQEQCQRRPELRSSKHTDPFGPDEQKTAIGKPAPDFTQNRETETKDEPSKRPEG